MIEKLYPQLHFTLTGVRQEPANFFEKCVRTTRNTNNLSISYVVKQYKNLCRQLYTTQCGIPDAPRKSKQNKTKQNKTQ